MKIRNVLMIVFVFLYILPVQARTESELYDDKDYSIKIAVTINENDNIVGKLEYSNRPPLYPIQLVTFGSVAGQIFSEPYVFEMIDKIILEPKLHQIKCRPLNDMYGYGTIFGSIDFRDRTSPKVTLVTENGRNYIGNITAKGKEFHSKMFPNVWLGN
jgi:hypothetical protein